MSYEKVKSFSFNKDFTSFKCIAACNNVRPLDYYTYERQAEPGQTANDFVKYWIKCFISGTFQMNNENNIIDFTINQVLKEHDKKSIRDLWITEYDFQAKYNYNENKWIWQNEDDQEQFENAKAEKEKILNEIAKAIISKKYNKLFNALKKEKYVLTNGYCYITSNGQRSFRYLGQKERAKKFNGLQKESMQNYFAITKHNYHFEMI